MWGLHRRGAITGNLRFSKVIDHDQKDIWWQVTRIGG
jgi:hypothetical protein